LSTHAATPLAVSVPDGDADERAVRQALAVPTRAAIYRVLRTEGRPHSAREIGERIGIHANVARGHLDVLVDAGLVTSGRRHNPNGGRPAKVYVAREQHVPAPRRAPAVPSGAVLGLQTALQLVAGLREHVARAELLAEDQGRRLVAVGGGRAASRTFDAALLIALEGLQVAFPGAHLRQDEDGASVIDGIRSELGLVGDVDEALSDALAVGFVRGAVAAAGAAADVEVADGTVRARAAAGDGALPLPGASVDARGIGFDRAVVRAMQAIGRLRPGAHLEVLTTAEGAPAAYARWADRAGHRITAVDRVRDHDGRPAVRILIRRAAGR
jgi:DNA-binding transcriptional ArsR family regulator/TusA-related sulfurtransferase